MAALFIVGIILFLLFFVAWTIRNLLKYMYGKQSILFNKIMWFGFLPLSIIGIALIIVSVVA